MSDEQLLPIEQETSLVSFTVKVNGEPVTGDIPVVSVTVWNEANRIAGASLVVSDGDAALADWPVSTGELFLPGNEIEILAGYHGFEETIFMGIVTTHALRLRQHTSELQVECRHKSSLLAIGRKSALFKDQKDSEIAATILDAEELTGAIEDTPVTHAEMVQYNATDWDFLITRLDALGFVAVTNLDKIDIIKPAVETEGIATLRFGTNLLEFDGEIDGSLQYGSVKAQSWDPAAGAPGNRIRRARMDDARRSFRGRHGPAACDTPAACRVKRGRSAAMGRRGRPPQPDGLPLRKGPGTGIRTGSSRYYGKPRRTWHPYERGGLGERSTA